MKIHTLASVGAPPAGIAGGGPGAGGRENTRTFVSLEDMASGSDALLQVSSPTDTGCERREALD